MFARTHCLGSNRAAALSLRLRRNPTLAAFPPRRYPPFARSAPEPVTLQTLPRIAWKYSYAGRRTLQNGPREVQGRSNSLRFVRGFAPPERVSAVCAVPGPTRAATAAEIEI